MFEGANKSKDNGYYPNGIDFQRQLSQSDVPSLVTKVDSVVLPDNPVSCSTPVHASSNLVLQDKLDNTISTLHSASTSGRSSNTTLNESSETNDDHLRIYASGAVSTYYEFLIYKSNLF